MSSGGGGGGDGWGEGGGLGAWPGRNGGAGGEKGGDGGGDGETSHRFGQSGKSVLARRGKHAGEWSKAFGLRVRFKVQW